MSQYSLSQSKVEQILGFVRKHYLAVLVYLTITISLLVWNGYMYAKHDQSIYIPLLKMVLNPELYPHDPLRVMLTHESTRFWYLTAPFFRLFGIETGFFILFYASTMFLMYSCYKIGSYLFKNPYYGLVASVAVLLLKLPTQMVEIFFAPREITVALMIFAIYLYVCKRELWAILLASVFINIHMIFASIVAVTLIAIYSIENIRSPKKILLVILLLHASVLPTIVLLLQRAGTQPSFQLNHDWIAFCQTIYISLFTPLRDESGKIIALQHALFTIGAVLIWSKITRNIPQAKIISYALIFITFCYFGILFMYEVYPATILMQLQLTRIMVYTIILSLIIFACFFTHFFITHKQRPLWQTVITGIFLFTILARIIIPGRLGPSTTGIFEDDKESRDIQDWARNNTDKDTLFFIPINDSSLREYNFRIFSERSVYISSADLWLSMLEPKYFTVTRERYDKVTHGEFSKAIEKKDNGRLWEIINNYEPLPDPDIDYVVTSSDKKLPFPIAYSNTKFIIYKIPQ